MTCRKWNGISQVLMRLGGVSSPYHLRLRHLATVSITDEQGTSYQWRRGGSQGGPDSGEYTGYTQFAPAPPKSSRELTVAIGSADFRFRL